MLGRCLTPTTQPCFAAVLLCHCGIMVRVGCARRCAPAATRRVRRCETIARGGGGGALVVSQFTLAADTGIHNIRVLLAPTDLRRNPAPTHPGNPSWTDRVYADLIQEMAEIPMGKIQVAGD